MMKQCELIDLLREALGFDSDDWRELLVRFCGKERFEELTAAERRSAFEGLRMRAINLGIWTERKGLDGRPGYASSDEIAAIEYLWVSAYPYKRKKDLSQTLRHFLFRTCGVSDLRFLRSEQAEALLASLGDFRCNRQSQTRFKRLNGDSA